MACVCFGVRACWTLGAPGREQTCWRDGAEGDFLIGRRAQERLQGWMDASKSRVGLALEGLTRWLMIHIVAVHLAKLNFIHTFAELHAPNKE